MEIIRWAHVTGPLLSYGDQDRFPPPPASDVRLAAQVALDLNGSADVRSAFEEFVQLFADFSRDAERLRRDIDGDTSADLQRQLPQKRRAIESAYRTLTELMRADVGHE